jgi:hypothetical protein
MTKRAAPQSRAKARSGGGITSNKLRQVPVRAGKRTLDAVSPSGVADLGASIGYKRVPLVKSTPKDFVPLGNSLTNNVGEGGPGTGRTIYPSGYQCQHGTPAKGEGGIQGAADRGARAILGPQPAQTQRTAAMLKGQRSRE